MSGRTFSTHDRDKFSARLPNSQLQKRRTKPHSEAPPRSHVLPTIIKPRKSALSAVPKLLLSSSWSHSHSPPI